MTDSPGTMQNGQSKSVGGAIEKMYQKKSQLEHILLRPDTYIGSVEKVSEQMWIYSSELEKMVQKEITYVPGLYKIFDEILVNAADNKQRDGKMNCIRVDINQETNEISVWNNGQGIPVVMHKDEKMFVPTMIFGHLLTSSNYNDEEQKVTGGRNGYGAKLCNIFSTKFTVETASRQYKKSFVQTWGDNMVKASEPKIVEYRGEDFTKVTFSPDLSKFKMTTLDNDIVSLMSRRAYDVAASSRGVAVFLNGNKLPVKNFKEYIELYIKDNHDDAGNPLKIVHEQANDRWEVAITMSDRGFQQVSFVNSIATTKGGRHVDNVADSIVKQLIEVLKKKNKGGMTIKPFQVKNHLWIFVNCLIVNPTFDSQTKENMTLQAKSFGSKCALSEKFIANASKCGIVESVLSWAKFKAQNDLAKTSGKKNSKIKGIPKLEDANDAGTRNSHLCTLILTEGDSAKTLAVSGLGVVGRDHYGVFPLRGKLLNVREATHKQILENAEINNVIKILGLQYKRKYTCLDDLKSLRYGKVMIMTDQDQDGSHIKGLVINFIHTNWPELLRLPFLEEFITPIVKVTKKNQELAFYSLPEFEEWKNDTPNHTTFNVKYYKGLGTSTSKEAKEYFTNIARHRIVFKYDGAVDDDNIVMAFSKKCVDQRKEWLTAHMDESKRRKLLGLAERYLYTKDTHEVSYTEFVNLELILFSNADNVRSIPCLVDGFKPGQRKVMFTCFKRNDKREVKVAQLAGSIAEMSAYHHGEQSLCSTIVNLAQNFVGSNNLNLLSPNGQFGTRLSGGKDSASPRYIFTMMSPLTRLIFHPADDPLLEYQLDDNQKIEPLWYIPIIPMVLVNGSEGIGTGWATKIPNFNPREIISNLRRMLHGDEPKMLHPWYKNFKGSIDYVSEQRYLANGNVSILNDNQVEITELPVGTWTQNYKENILEALLHGSEKVKSIITDYKEYHTDTTVRFVVTFAPGEFDRLRSEEGGFHRVFKLTNSISLSTMYCFDNANCLRKFEHPNQVLKEFFDLRIDFYARRKKYMEGMLQADADRLSNQARFILEKCDRTLVVENKKRKTIIDELIKRGYQSDPVQAWKRSIKMEDAEPADDEETENTEEVEVVEKKGSKAAAAAAAAAAAVDPEKAFQKLADVKKYNYLLGMSMWMLTEERKNELLKQRDNKLSELNILLGKTREMLWIEDLDVLSTKLEEVEKEEQMDELGMNKKQAKAMKGKVTGRNKVAAGDIFPSNHGIKVEFKLTNELIKKFEKATQAAGSRKVIKKEKVEALDDSKANSGDEFDAMVESGDGALAAIIGEDVKPDITAIATAAATTTSALAKPKATTKVKKEPKPKKEKEPKVDKPKPASRKKADKGRGDDSGDDYDDDDVHATVNAPPVRERVGRRAASQKIRYTIDDDEDSNAMPVSDDDFEPKPQSPNANQSTDDLFNSLIAESPAKKTGKTKLGPKVADVKAPTAKRQRKKKTDSSDDDDYAFTKKKKAISISDDSDSDY